MMNNSHGNEGNAVKKLISVLGCCFLLVPAVVLAQGPDGPEVTSGDVDIVSDGQAYASYLAAPATGGPYPGIVLIHSFRGLEEGYRTMTDAMAARGFVVLAVGWQTFETSPTDATVDQLLRDSISFLEARSDVDPARLGLTGFCAGGRYTMLFLPQIDAFGAGVAWYGFPHQGDPQPVALVDQLDAPLLIIHGTADNPSPIAGIYEYANALTGAGKYFELKVYYGEPHGFMLSGGALRQDEVAQDALEQMVSFFQRKLAASG
jgi:carboxymethylenebutenolidase